MHVISIIVLTLKSSLLLHRSLRVLLEGRREKKETYELDVLEK